MHTAIKNHLEATILGTGVEAAIRALHNLYGMTGTEIATALNRDRTMVHAYYSGRTPMPSRVQTKLRDTLKECLTVAKSIPTRDANEDELLAAIVGRTEAILETL